MPDLTWSVYGAWNDQIGVREERPPLARNYIWASEIGGSFVDRYLKMQGVPQTNPPNPRSLRKFLAGNIWEWIIGFVLRRAGILIECQERLEYQYPELLKVTGKLDFLAGGQPDWAYAAGHLKALGLPPEMEQASIAIVRHLRDTYGDEPLKTIVIEVKSVGSYMFGRYESTQQANPNHRGQIFHYLKAKDLDEGHIVYVSKDDCRMIECGIYNPSTAENEYKADIVQMTEYYNAGEQPPLAPEVLFDDQFFSFRTNWHVEYSGYLTKLYGYDEPIHYREKWDKTVASFNRTFKRCVTEAKMTDLNKSVIAEAKVTFPDWDAYVAVAQEKAKTHPELLPDMVEA